MTTDAAGFWERYRRMFNKRENDWWHIVFGYPLGRLLVVIIAPLRLITPNGITVAGFGATLGAAWLLTRPGDDALIAAVVLLQVATVLDAMDGTLARHRGSFSRIGAFLDKVFDAFGLFALCAAVGLRAYWATGEPWWIVCACAGGASYLTLCYMYWVVQAMQPEPMNANAVAGVADIPTWGDIGRTWLRGWIKIAKFEEADLYFWIALGAVLGEWKWLAVGLAASQGLTVLYKFFAHARRLSRA